MSVCIGRPYRARNLVAGTVPRAFALGCGCVAPLGLRIGPEGATRMQPGQTTGLRAPFPPGCEALRDDGWSAAVPP